jgi:hypothetical protein
VLEWAGALGSVPIKLCGLFGVFSRVGGSVGNELGMSSKFSLTRKITNWV